jgi:hypothetical protein
MLDPNALPPPPGGMGAPPLPPGLAAGPGGAPPAPGGGGGLPPELMAALGGAEGALPPPEMGGNSLDLMGEGPLAGEETALAGEDAGEEDPLSLVREAISLLRRAGDIEPDDQRSHLIDKIQADAQKILAGESQKTDKLRAALGG